MKSYDKFEKQLEVWMKQQDDKLTHEMLATEARQGVRLQIGQKKAQRAICGCRSDLGTRGGGPSCVGHGVRVGGVCAASGAPSSVPRHVESMGGVH